MGQRSAMKGSKSAATSAATAVVRSSGNDGTLIVTILTGETAHLLSISMETVALRELEMNQTAIKLGIPPQRWRGSLLFREWKKHKGDCSTVHITLHPDADTKTLAANWTSRATLDWIQTYYTTGTLMIPRSARGYDVLAAVEYFGILYQPDQCHFADFQVYKRVQQWSRYLCHRATLATWVVHAMETTDSMTASFCTKSDGTVGMELGTSPLRALGADHEDPIKNTARIAYKLFNSPDHEHQHQQGDNHDDDAATLPAPEEQTASEMRADFCKYLESALSDHTISFGMKPVTIYAHSKPANSSSSPRLHSVSRAVLVVEKRANQSNSTPQQTLSAAPASATDFKKLKTISSRSELSAPVDELVDEDMQKGKLETILQQVEARNNGSKMNSSSNSNSSIKINTSSNGSKLNTSSNSSTKLNSSSNSFKLNSSSNSSRLNTSSSSSNTPKPSEPRGASEPEGRHIYEDFADRIQATIDKAPSDERTPKSKQDGTDNLPPHLDVSKPTLPPATSSRKKKKKPKPHFELPDKMLEQKALTRANPVVKSPAGLNPAPVHLVRAGTYDNTVTSALTGPFYVDDNGNLRDVFERLSPPNLHEPRGDGDDDYYPNDDGDDTDDDTRAQARRHDWIQTALLNRGITERMETLLNVEDGQSTAGFAQDGSDMDAWDWLTGLGVCQLSRNVMESVGKYASPNKARFPEASFPEPEAAATEPNKSRFTEAPRTKIVSPDRGASSKTARSFPAPHIIKSIISHDTNETPKAQKPEPATTQNIPIKKSPSRVKDRLRMVQATVDESLQVVPQSREDVPFDVQRHEAFVNDHPPVDNREDGFYSQCSKESPTGVVLLNETGCGSTASLSKKSNESSGKKSSDSSKASLLITSAEAIACPESGKLTTFTFAEPAAATSQKKSRRGIKSLFRRR